MRSVTKGLTVALVLAYAAWPTAARAQVRYVEHGPFTRMLDAMTAINRDDSRRLDGYRVQIVSTTDRLALEAAEEKFERLYPHYPTTFVHEPPYYKLRTGAFTDRARATTFLFRLKEDFPSAYPAVVDDIRPAELLVYR